MSSTGGSFRPSGGLLKKLITSSSMCFINSSLYRKQILLKEQSDIAILVRVRWGDYTSFNCLASKLVTNQLMCEYWSDLTRQDESISLIVELLLKAQCQDFALFSLLNTSSKCKSDSFWVVGRCMLQFLASCLSARAVMSWKYDESGNDIWSAAG